MIKYGKYLVLYSIVKILKENANDFTNWNYNSNDVNKKLNEENYKKIIKTLTSSWKTTVTDKLMWDSNAFKKDDNFNNSFTNCRKELEEILLNNEVVEVLK
jgi:hypothetical protein